MLSHFNLDLHHSSGNLAENLYSFHSQFSYVQLKICIPDVCPGLKHRGFIFCTKLSFMQFKSFHDIPELK